LRRARGLACRSWRETGMVWGILCKCLVSGGNGYLAVLVARGVSIVARVAADGTVDWLTRGNDDEDPSLGKWRICERFECPTCEFGDPNSSYQPFFVLQKPDESTGRWRNWYFGALDTNTIRRMLLLTSQNKCLDECACLGRCSSCAIGS
jgi:hypothetical protein